MVLNITLWSDDINKQGWTFRCVRTVYVNTIPISCQRCRHPFISYDSYRVSMTFVWMMTSSNGNIFHVTGHLCGEFTGPGEFPTQRPVTRSFDVFFDLRLNKRLSEQPWGWWFETPSWSLWRQCNGWFSSISVTHQYESVLAIKIILKKTDGFKTSKV